MATDQNVAISMRETLLDTTPSDQVTRPAPASNKRGMMLAGGAILLIGVLSVAVVALALRSNGSSSSSSTPVTNDAQPMSKEKVVGENPTNGEMTVYGRTVQYAVTSSFVALKVRFFARVTDKETGTVVNAYGYKSGQSALEYGIEKLFNTLLSKGIISEMPNEQQSEQMLITLPSAKDMDEESAPESELLGLGSSKCGDIEVYGRAIHYCASAYRKGLTLRYKADATDKATGIKGSASGTKSGQGAVEHATQDLFQKLIKAGIVVPPTPKDGATPQADGGSTEDYHFVPDGIDWQAESDLFGKSGNTIVCGRNIHWSAGAYYKFPLSIKYKCDAKDTASGISSGVRGKSKGEDACKEAIKNVMTQVVQRGLPLDPTKNCPRSKVAGDNGFNTLGETVMSAPMEEEADPQPTAVVQGLASKSGDITVYGRAIHWTASGYLKGLSWRYKATATDKATGIKGSASGLKSGKGAVEHATQNLFQTLIARGIIPPPPAGLVAQSSADPVVDYTLLPTIIDGTLEDVEDGSQSKEADLQFAEDAEEMDEMTMAEGAVAVLDSEEDGIDEVDEPLMLKGLFSKEGDTVVYGRTIHYKASGYLKGLSWRYKCTATDKATGISASSSGFKSGEGAVKDAITKVFTILQQQGKFP